MESAVLPLTKGIPFHTTNWAEVDVTEHPGETGVAQWRTIQLGTVRVRQVSYSPGYKADHWCTKGHILLCLDGELMTELSDGRMFILNKGMSYQVSDDVSIHKSSTESGATLFIVDGDFLKIEKSTHTRGLWM